MLKFKSLAGLAATALLLASLASPAFAQKGQARQDQNGNSYASSLPSLGSASVALTWTNPACPKAKVELKSSRPVGTGDGLLDAILALELAKDVQAIRGSWFSGWTEGDCDQADADSPGESSRTFEAHSPSPGILSILYTLFESYPFAAHPNTNFEAFNYYLKEGRELRLSDILPDFYDWGALWAEVAKGWCSYNDYHSIPSFYGLSQDVSWCEQKQVPVPPAIAANSFDLAAWGHAYVTADGLALQLGPYEGWSYADGPSSLTIPKAFLIKLGADPAIWK